MGFGVGKWGLGGGVVLGLLTLFLPILEISSISYPRGMI